MSGKAMRSVPIDEIYLSFSFVSIQKMTKLKMTN